MVYTLAFGPDNMLCTGSLNGTAMVWHLNEPGAPMRILQGHTAGVKTLAFGPDGQLVTGSDDFTVRVWDLKDAAVAPLVFRGHAAAISSVACTRDGQIVTGGLDHNMRVWELDLDRLIQKAGTFAARNLTYTEWVQFFGPDLYQQTFPDLPDGHGVSEVRQGRSPTRPYVPSLIMWDTRPR